MSLEASLVIHAKSLRERAHELDGFLNELKALLPDNETARHVFINARRTVGFVHSEITQIQTTLAVARMTGAMTSEPRPPLQTELPIAAELRAASRPRPRRPDGKMLAAGEKPEPETTGGQG